jgi:hypothetical protein
MDIILKKDLTISDQLNNISNKIDIIASKLNIKNTSDKKLSYTIDNLLLVLNKFEQKQDISTNIKKNTSEMEALVYQLEDEICIKQNLFIDNIINEIIKCIQLETTELKKICSNKIKLILNNNNLNSNIRNKLILLNNLIINSK